jgi:NAD+ diphosphatase
MNSGKTSEKEESMDHYQRSSLNCFAEHSVERLSKMRQNDGWVMNRLKDPTTRFVPLWKSKFLIAEEPDTHVVFLSQSELGDSFPFAEATVLLGEEKGTLLFAIDLPSFESSPPKQLIRFGTFRDLRETGAILNSQESALLAYAKAITYWHSRHRFCSDCGKPTVSAEAGHLRVCSNEECKQQHFPRTDPAIIVLVASGDQCMLARQPVWPKGLYATLAGFVEPGESLEGAVMREVLEESGIQLKRINYHSSQPWPFPGSIMLGFIAQAENKDIVLDDGELEDARWFSRKEVQNGLELVDANILDPGRWVSMKEDHKAPKQGTIQLPPPLSISYRLIKDWADGSELG